MSGGFSGTLGLLPHQRRDDKLVVEAEDQRDQKSLAIIQHSIEKEEFEVNSADSFHDNGPHTKRNPLRIPVKLSVLNVKE